MNQKSLQKPINSEHLKIKRFGYTYNNIATLQEGQVTKNKQTTFLEGGFVCFAPWKGAIL